MVLVPGTAILVVAIHERRKEGFGCCRSSNSDRCKILSKAQIANLRHLNYATGMAISIKNQLNTRLFFVVGYKSPHSDILGDFCKWQVALCIFFQLLQAFVTRVVNKSAIVKGRPSDESN